MANHVGTSLMYSLVVFLVTYQLSQYYVNGDQEHYIGAYNLISNMEIGNAYLRYTALLSSSEVVHFLLIWTVGGVFDKDIVMSVSNAMLAYLATYSMLRVGANKIIVLLVLLISYYPLVLFLSAERLKFSFIFFFLSFISSKNGFIKFYEYWFTGP